MKRSIREKEALLRFFLNPDGYEQLDEPPQVRQDDLPASMKAMMELMEQEEEMDGRKQKTEVRN